MTFLILLFLFYELVSIGLASLPIVKTDKFLKKV